MTKLIRIHTASTGWVEAEIDETLNPETAGKIITALPFSSIVRRWGEEVYFEIPVTTGEENAQIEVEIGNLGFWPAGNCFCIFFGPTPASQGDKPVAASPVNIFGRIIDSTSTFSRTTSGEKITVELKGESVD